MMAFYPQYQGYQPQYYPQPVPDQLAQLRQAQMMQGPQMVPQQMQPPAAQPAPQQSNGMIWVKGKAEADSYLIAPGCAVALWDSNDSVVYLRQADSTGKPSTKVFDLVERTEDLPARQATPQIDLSNYITREQLEEILAERLKRPSKPTRQKEDTDNG